MEYSESYWEIGNAAPHASLLALLPPGTSEDISATEQRLRAAGIDVTFSGERLIRGSRWELAGPDGTRFWLEPTPYDHVEQDIAWRGITAPDLTAAHQSDWSIGIGGRLVGGDGGPLVAYHKLVKLLRDAVPNTPLVLDLDSNTPRTGFWLSELADATTPPSPTEVYTIHSVFPDCDEGKVWLHTHGLNRCGAIELDMLEVPREHVGVCGQLLNSVAALALEGEIPGHGEVFEAGAGIELVWLPWEQAVLKVGRDVLGGRRDRAGTHRGARGILFAPERRMLRRKYRSAGRYADTLCDNPLLFVSTPETTRRADMARERFDRFRKIHREFGDREGWLMLIKLGYPVDGATAETEREHLWFRVHGIDDREVDATLMNQPYHIAAMNEGDRRRHSLDQLSEWTILCRHGRFDPDCIGELERILTAEPGEWGSLDPSGALIGPRT